MLASLAIIITTSLLFVTSVNLNAFAVRLEAKHVAAGQFVRLNHRLEVSDMIHVLVHICSQHLPTSNVNTVTEVRSARSQTVACFTRYSCST